VLGGLARGEPTCGAAMAAFASSWQARELERGARLRGYVHARMRGQRSCFTIHGTAKSGLDSLLAGPAPAPWTGPWPILKRYVVDPACRQSMRSELAVLGTTESVAFPDIDGLANELAERFS
jgi:hypothetical protein